MNNFPYGNETDLGQVPFYVSNPAVVPPPPISSFVLPNPNVANLYAVDPGLKVCCAASIRLLITAPQTSTCATRFRAAVSYQIPAPSGRWGRALLGNWLVDAIVRGSSALPFTVITTSDFPVFGGYFTRPDIVPGVPFLHIGPEQVSQGHQAEGSGFFNTDRWTIWKFATQLLSRIPH